jgi:hypothetical protein
MQAQGGHRNRAGAGAAGALGAGIGLPVVGSDFIRHIGLSMLMGHPIAMIVRGLVDVRRSLDAMLMPGAGGGRLLAVGRALPVPVHARQRAAVEHERRCCHEHQAHDEAPEVGPQGVQRFAPDIR